MPELDLMQIIIIAAIVLAVFELVVLTIIDALRSNSQAKKYMKSLDQSYDNEGVLGSLKNASNNLPKRCDANKAVKKATDYLEHSNKKDYKTALGMIEKELPKKEIKKKHAEILEVEQQKTLTFLALPDTALNEQGGTTNDKQDHESA